LEFVLERAGQEEGFGVRHELQRGDYIVDVDDADGDIEEL